MGFESVNQIDEIRLYRDFEATEYGQRLAASSRWAKYNLANVDQQTWESWLGSDANNARHMLVGYAIARYFFTVMREEQPNTFDEADEKIVKVGQTIHDQGEAVLGDISWGDKTDNDEVSELAIVKNRIRDFNPSVSNEQAGALVQIMQDVVLNPDKTSELAEVSDVIERLGYLRTAIRAFDNLQAGKGLDDQSQFGMKWLVTDVLTNQIPIIIELAKKYAPVDNYLASQKDKITAMFGEDVWHFDHYDLAKRPAKQAAHTKALIAWLQSDFLETAA